MVDHSHPAALKAVRSNPAALRDRRSNSTAFKDGWSMATPRAEKTALTATKRLKFKRPRVRTAEDAMSGREEEALAASMMRTQHCRVTSSAAARHTSL
jgi:hypothetical protein